MKLAKNYKMLIYQRVSNFAVPPVPRVPPTSLLNPPRVAIRVPSIKVGDTSRAIYLFIGINKDSRGNTGNRGNGNFLRVRLKTPLKSVKYPTRSARQVASERLQP